jgi:ABC-type Fe3+/spermidine/putrescine transport system ATPase subunit
MSDKQPFPHVLEFRAVVKRFHTVNAVHGVSFSLQRGEVFTLLGPSGCGKTTTLRLVAGLEEPDEGEILIDGETVAAPDRGLFVPPDKRRLGMVFQSYAIWPHLSVFENVAFPLRVRRHSVEDLRRRVYQVLEIVGLAGLEERGATQLSGGQQQRVALARALVYEPAILLLDEPLSNLDAKLREQMRGEIRALQRRLGLTILYVTHDQAEAMTLSDRVAVVNGGRFEQIGTPEDVYESPATPFVAEFLGRVVSFAGTIAKTAAGCWIEFPNDAGRYALAGAVTDSLTHGALAKVTTRPENIEICVSTGPAPNQLAATIEEVAYLGERFEYQVSAAGSSFVLAAPKRQRFRPGDIVRLVLDPARVNVRLD